MKNCIFAGPFNFPDHERYEIVNKGCYEIKVSQKGTPLIVYRGFKYCTSQRAKYGTKYWVCTSRSSRLDCKARCILKNDGSLLIRKDHIHPPKYF